MNDNVVYPSIHLNGTSKAELEHQLESAGQALMKALTAVTEAQPNLRDYYPQGDTLSKLAQSQHVSRLARVQAVLAEIHQLYEYVADSADPRERGQR